MTMRKFFSIGMILVLLTILSIAATWPQTTQQNASPTPTQQAACPGNSIVRVIPGENGKLGPALNIRKNSGGNIAGNIITGALRYEDGEKHIVEEKDGYLRLEQGGWIWNRYLTIVCVTPTPAISLTPSPTWCAACTPTPLVSRTPTPTQQVVIVTASPPPPILVFKYRGTPFFECRVPCEGLSIDLSR